MSGEWEQWTISDNLELRRVADLRADYIRQHVLSGARSDWLVILDTPEIAAVIRSPTIEYDDAPLFIIYKKGGTT